MFYSLVNFCSKEKFSYGETTFTISVILRLWFSSFSLLFFSPPVPEKCYFDLQGGAADHNWALLWVILPWVQARCLHHFANHRCHHHFQGHHHHHHLHHNHNHQEGLCNHGVVVMMQSQSLSPDWSQLHHQQSCHFVKTFALRKSLPSSSSSLLTEPLSLACCILPLRNWRTLESWR